MKDMPVQVVQVADPQAARAVANFHPSLVNLLYQLADDELVMGHRTSEWLGLAPDLEEDIAFGSMAQDEIGHATYYFELLADLGEGDANVLAFNRAPKERLNAQVLERPNGDWAYSIARRYLYDVYEQVRLSALTRSSYVPLQQGAVKMLREERYHLLHLETWFARLAIAGGEARERLEQALDELWPELGDLFSFGESSTSLLDLAIFPLSENAFYSEWEASVKPMFQQVGLAWPGRPPLAANGQNGRFGHHSVDLTELLQVMGEVSHADPAASW